MSEEEVTGLLGGPPVRRFALVTKVDGDGRIVPSENDTPIIWEYDSGPSLFGGLELELRFIEGELHDGAVRLTPIPTSLGDLLDGKSTPLLFVGGRYEKPEFSKHLRCP